MSTVVRTESCFTSGLSHGCHKYGATAASLGTNRAARPRSHNSSGRTLLFAGRLSNSRHRGHLAEKRRLPSRRQSISGSHLIFRRPQPRHRPFPRPCQVSGHRHRQLVHDREHSSQLTSPRGLPYLGYCGHRVRRLCRTFNRPRAVHRIPGANAFLLNELLSEELR